MVSDYVPAPMRPIQLNAESSETRMLDVVVEVVVVLLVVRVLVVVLIYYVLRLHTCTHASYTVECEEQRYQDAVVVVVVVAVLI